MFTGIIENKGIVLKKAKSGGQVRFSIGLKRAERNLKLGESIAVNGVCLTVAKKTNKSFEADVMSETLKATSLGSLALKDQVNLERALKYGDRLGGHFVLGHVDGIGKIKKIKRQGKNQIWSIQTKKAILKQLAMKGSVAIDGISLTIQKLRKDAFDVALIPFTLKETNLQKKKEGDIVNLEIDMITRYGNVKPSKRMKSKAAITLRNLQANGF